MHELPTRTRRRRWRADLAATPGTGRNRVVDQALRTARDTEATSNPVCTDERAAEIVCSRSCRMQQLAAYVFGEDGAFWLAFADCKHGLPGEVTPIYVPGFEIAAADVGAPAVDERLGNVN